MSEKLDGIASTEIVVGVTNEPPALPDLSESEVESAKAYARASRASSTRRVYTSDWNHFAAWCLERGAIPLPARAPTVAVYLGTEADRHLSPLTIGRKLAAIAWFHREHGHQAPQATEAGNAILSVMAGIRRSEHTAPIKKAAADADIIRDTLRAITGDTLRDIRDRAVLGFGMPTAMRRSELVTLQMTDLKRTPDGMLVTVRRSKTDQDGKGSVIPVPIGRRIEPVRLLEEWLAAAGLTDGYVFRRLSLCGKRLRSEPMSDQSIARVVKARVAAAGYDPSVFAGHSLRSGFLTSAAATGATVFKMQEISRHKSLDVLAGYVRDSKVFTNHAGDGFM